jgi:hypothetical protein
LNSQVVQNALGELERLLSETKSALRQVEAEVFRIDLTDEGGWYEFPRLALAGHLQDLYDILSVVLEAAEMPETRAQLIRSWQKFASGNQGLQRTTDDQQFQACESPALNFVQHMIDGLRMSVTTGISREEAWTLRRLEEMLRDTPALVHRRENRPANEEQLQKIMHDYLSACFPDFRLNPPISGILKNFKPDCGIASIGAAIEFKIVHKREDVAVAFSGVAEDSAGYRGSLIGTLYEFAVALRKINESTEFQTIRTARAFDWDAQDPWDQAIQFFATNEELIKKVRHDVGGHFGETVAFHAVDNFDTDEVGKIELTLDEHKLLRNPRLDFVK